MAARESEVVDPQEFIPICDYHFAGDNPTVEKKRAFVLAYREHGSIYHAAIASRIHRSTYYDWIERDPVFLEAVEDCKEDCSDQVESSVFKKAVNGSTLDAIFYLKAHRPKFRDRVTIDIDSVKDEIEQRMAQVNLKQLPPAMTQFLQSAETRGIKQLPHQPAQIQKESSDSESSE
jgi:hypothetical protein